MNKLDYTTNAEILVENACNELSPREFEDFKKSVVEIVENYE